MRQGRAIPKVGNPSRHLPHHPNLRVPLAHHSRGWLLSQATNPKFSIPEEEFLPVSLPGSNPGVLGMGWEGMRSRLDATSRAKVGANALERSHAETPPSLGAGMCLLCGVIRTVLQQGWGQPR